METIFTEKQIQSRKLLVARIQNWSILIDEGKAESIERQIARSVESELQVWRENEAGVRRGMVTTRFDRNVSRALKETIMDFEKAKRGVEDFNEDVYREIARNTQHEDSSNEQIYAWFSHQLHVYGHKKVLYPGCETQNSPQRGKGGKICALGESFSLPKQHIFCVGVSNEHLR